MSFCWISATRGSLAFSSMVTKSSVPLEGEGELLESGEEELCTPTLGEEEVLGSAEGSTSGDWLGSTAPADGLGDPAGREGEALEVAPPLAEGAQELARIRMSMAATSTTMAAANSTRVSRRTRYVRWPR